jgi:hypothetical protein
MLVIALAFGIYNFLEIRELRERFSRRTTIVSQPKIKQPIQVPRPKGHWD